jgi:GT2 family glycosyltransferase
MISVVMAYHNRRHQLFHTLTTISESNYKKFEIVIVDDFSNEENNIDNIKDNFPNLNINLIKMQKEVDEKWYRNPCVPYNIGFIKSKGDKIIVQNPECCHMGDIISYTAENLNNENYLSFHCYATGVDDTKLIRENKDIVYHEKTIKEGRKDSSKWYNHATYRPASYHFCTALTRENLIKLNGFDERYALGHNCDDDDFVARVRRLKLRIDFVNSPFAIHQYHGIEVSTLVTTPLADNRELWSRLRHESYIIAPNKTNIL